MATSRQSEGPSGMESRHSLWTGLLIGAVAGLILGLIVGWGLWPVSWTNALPGDLSDEAQADYVASVADAYVAARSRSASDLAAQRLRYFGDREAQAQALLDARNWYEQNQPDEWGVRTINLNELASALGLADLPGVDGADTAGATERATAVATAGGDFSTAPEIDVTSVPDQAEPVGTEPGWASWFLVTLAALLLIAGGLYMLRRLYGMTRQPLSSAPENVAAADGTAIAAYDDGSRADDFDTSYAGVDDEIEARAREMEYHRQTGPRAADDDYSFDDETDDIPTAGTASISIQPTAPGQPQGSSVADVTEDVSRGQAGDSGGDDDGDVNAPAGGFQAESDETAPPSAAGRPVETGEPVPMPAADVGASVDAGEASGPRVGAGRRLESFRAHYQYGIPDYDEAFNVRDSERGAYIGECGMGVNMRMGILQSNPENVVALDVWLFDKVNEREPVTETIVLVSRGLAESRREQGPAHVVAEPGARFVLRAKHLLLECIVEQVTTSNHPDNPGVFQDVQVAMTVYRG